MKRWRQFIDPGESVLFGIHIPKAFIAFSKSSRRERESNTARGQQNKSKPLSTQQQLNREQKNKLRHVEMCCSVRAWIRKLQEVRRYF